MLQSPSNQHSTRPLHKEWGGLLPTIAKNLYPFFHPLTLCSASCATTNVRYSLNRGIAAVSIYGISLRSVFSARNASIPITLSISAIFPGIKGSQNPLSPITFSSFFTLQLPPIAQRVRNFKSYSAAKKISIGFST